MATPSRPPPARGGHLAAPALLAGLAALLLIAAAAPAATLRAPGIEVVYPAGQGAMARALLRDFPPALETQEAWLGIHFQMHCVLHLVAGYAAMERLAPGAPRWAVAVTRPDDVLVFRIDRVNRSPSTRLEVVIDHESVHAALNHLAGPRLPRWFEEGLCVFRAGTSYLQPDYSLQRLAAAGNLPTFAQAERAFTGSAADAAVAYRLGEQAVSFFLQRYQVQTLRRLLRETARGDPFPIAFQTATFEPLAEFEKSFRDSVDPGVPLVLYVVFENLELSLLCFAALLVVVGALRHRAKRKRELEAM